MIDPLHQLEALSRDPRLQVRPEQRAKIVENIIHSTMHPYFLKKSPEEQEQFRPHYLQHMQMLADYCLREYIESPEPRLTIEVVKGLHRVLYHNSASVPVKAMDGSMLTMVPGEFKTSPVFVRTRNRVCPWYCSSAPEEAAREMDQLLAYLHDPSAPLFARYLRFMIDLTLIHPFPDSNGKVAWLLGDLFLLRQGVLPPYFARFPWENEAGYYQALWRYRHDPQRDIAIFYPALLRLYADCGFASLFDVENSFAGEATLPEDATTLMVETVAACLSPRFHHLHGAKPEEERVRFMADFQEQTRMLGEYLCQELAGKNLSVETVVGLHQRLYPPGAIIEASDRHGNLVLIRPGAWRQRELTPTTYHARKPFGIVCSSPATIETDLGRIIAAFNQLSNPRREDILRFRFDFIRVHPFADSNGTTAALLADTLCVLHGFTPLRLLSLRFQNKHLVWVLIHVFESNPSDQTLTYILNQLDEFHRLFPIMRLSPGLKKNNLPLGANESTKNSARLPPPSLDYQVCVTLLAEADRAVETGDLPVGAALTVGNTLVASHRNTIFSSQGRRFHAERNLLANLENAVIPAGRRVLWVTMEPCMRCAQAIARFGVDEVVYVLDDPFGGGKALLAKAGVAVTRKPEWERATLGMMMAWYTKHPEGCGDRPFQFFWEAWQRYFPASRAEQVRAVLLRHLAPYLPGRKTAEPSAARQELLAWVDGLARLALREYTAGAPSLAFVRDLHRALFPPGHRLRAVGNDGVATETGGGEWRRHVLWPHYTGFSAPETIEVDLVALLADLFVKESWRREDALQFFFDFTTIHPFTDGNWRLAAILADLLCLNHGLAPLALDRMNVLFKKAILENLSAGTPINEQLALVDGWNQGRLGIKPRSIYDVYPSVWQTYTKRTGNKQYVVEQILAKLAGRPLASPLVITDLGAGTGIIADGLLHALAQQEGLDFTYHCLEPSQASVDHFRATSRYASLPQVEMHVMPVEEFLLPPSDLIIVVQASQHFANPAEALHDMLSALKPGGLALVVNNHPDSDELRITKAFGLANENPHARCKAFFEQARCAHEEMVVESSLRITPVDRETPEGDDLLHWYLRQPATSLPPAIKDAFWQAVAGFAKDGLLQKKESFFWIEAGGVT